MLKRFTTFETAALLIFELLTPEDRPEGRPYPKGDRLLYLLPGPKVWPSNQKCESQAQQMSLAWRKATEKNRPGCFGLLWEFSRVRRLDLSNYLTADRCG